MLQIPYKVVGGPRFFERAEIRDAHAYLRLIQSEDDDLAFERIVNRPSAASATPPCQAAAARPRQGRVGLGGGARADRDRRADGADAHRAGQLPARPRPLARSSADVTPHPQLMETMLEESGYTDVLRADKGPTSQTRLENLKELVQSMAAFDTLEAYLEHVSLVMDLDREAEGDAVQIMTLHSAKGLEFPLVFLPGWEEGVFPSQRSMDEKGEKGLEEERRLAYVGITRAREEARISFAANRQVYGRWTSQLPSRFVDELPIANVEASQRDRLLRRRPGHAGARRQPLGRGARASAAATPRPAGSGPRRGRRSARPDRRCRRPRRCARGASRSRARAGWSRSPTPAATAPTSAATGSSTRSSATAQVTAVEGNKLTVAFDKAGEKKVIDSFVERA